MPRLTICALVTISALFLSRSSQAFTEDPARLVRDSAPRTAEDERKGFHVPEGFEVQLFADESQLGGKPINMAFDARGRMWVTCSREYPFAVKKDKWSPDTTRAIGSQDTIRILEDTDGDGRADKVTVFANDMNIPTGIQPYKNGCIAWSIPNILFLEDTQAAQNSKAQSSSPKPPTKCDKRTILFGPLGYEKDTHGMISSMRLGLDGWIYATHGFSNTSHFHVLPQNQKPNPKSAIQNPKSDTLDITSGSVFRFKPDGSSVELWTSGQVNPFGLCWDSWGNLYSADCHSHPITQLIRGATYPQFGKPADALGFGPVMCEHMHGSTGIAGIIYLDGGVWGKEWDDHMFVGNPVTSKVNHDHITFTGSTPKANERPDFLTSDDGWFRPVDLQIGPDGALYIADFYNKIIGHYELPLDDKRRDRSTGRIWRVVRKGFTGKLAECDISRAEDKSLFNTIGSFKKGNLTKANLASRELADRGESHPTHRPANNWDTDPHGCRHSLAADMEEPSISGIESRLGWFDWIKADDVQMLYALRVVLKTELSLPGGFAALSKLKPSSVARTELIRVSCAVPNTDAANWLLEQIKTSASSDKKPLDRALLTQAITHIARHLPAEREGELIELVQKNFGDDLDTQLDLFAAVREGQSVLGPKTRAWTADLAQRLLDSLSAQKSPDWQPVPNPQSKIQNPQSASPWFKQKRKCDDGTERDFLCSLPPGGEKLTGTVRSKPFPLPEKLSFWLAGHRGPPASPAHDKNLIRLVDAQTGTELARAYPPRNDTARQVIWDFARQKTLEVAPPRQKPAESARSRVPENGSPTPDNRSPTADNRSPTPDNRSPTSDNRSPTPDNRSPTADNRSPTADNRSPTADNRSPTADNRSPTADNRSPTTDNRSPTPDNRSPTADNRSPTPDNRSPTPDNRSPEAQNSPKTPETGKTGLKTALSGTVYLELTDGDSGSAYAWLAAGGFEPAVVGIPDLNSSTNDKRILRAAEIAAIWETHENPGALITKSITPAFPDLAKRLNALPHRESFSPDARVGLARLSFNELIRPTELPELTRDPELAAPVFAILGNGADEKAEIAKAFKTLTSRAQLKLASALAGTRETAATLLNTAPPRIVADPLVSGKLKALNDAALTKQLGDITAKLPPLNDAVNALIASRLKSYDPATADEARGKAVFAQICVVCHRIGVFGNLVGPQLDGIGARGPERLLEDILDPNRSVDPAFRLHIVKMKSGAVMSGLLRRDDGSVRVFADAAAQEHEVRAADIAEDTVSEFSLMPSGLGDVLTEQQLHDLLRFLLERK